MSPQKTRLLPRIFRSMLLLLNFGAIAWLLLCKWASIDDPEGSPQLLSLLSFSAPFAYLANIFFIVFWLCSKRKLRVGYSIVTLAICWSLIRPLLAFNYFGENKTEAGTGDLKIMTWNVHMFDLGEWTKDETSKAKIIKLIKEENPDILCLQEFYWNKKEDAEPYTALLQQLGYPYVKLSKENAMKKQRMTRMAAPSDVIYIGNAVFSKFPLRNEQEYELGKDNYRLLVMEVVVDSSRIFNLNVVHLTSVRFGEEEMQYIDKVKRKGVDAQNKRQSRRLIGKLTYAFAHRAVLANHIDSIKRYMDYPIIVCGDFNDVPGSYVYEKIRGELADAFVAKGAGIGRTYRNIFPTLRIDYILYDANALRAEGYIRPDVGLSDHFPVIANFSILPKDNPVP